MGRGIVITLMGLAVAAVPGDAIGQAPGVPGVPGVSIGFETGLAQHGSRDMVASSLGYAGWGSPLGARLTVATQATVHAASFSFASLTLPALNGGPAEVEELGVALRYSYDRQVAGDGLRRWYVGGEWATTAALRAYSHGGAELWDGHTGLAVRVRVSQALGSGRVVSAAASSGVLGWAMRPPYSVEDNTTLVLHEDPSRIATTLGHLTGPWNRPSARLELDLASPLALGLRARVGYALDWAYSLDPRPATTVRSGLRVTLAYGFGGGHA